jgi:hypothetical protein
MFFRQIPYQHFPEARQVAKDLVFESAILIRRRWEQSRPRPRIASVAAESE